MLSSKSTALTVFALLGLALSPSLKADQWNKKTVLTVTEAIQCRTRCSSPVPTCSSWPIRILTATSCRSSTPMKPTSPRFSRSQTTEADR
ncbi:MAG: hypothetical protein QOJ99_2398 [Bryobacterales bacterium]|jgi:hypothetical protein|nr:hypothetical protein [Bryobacterales bacterium]